MLRIIVLFILSSPFFSERDATAMTAEDLRVDGIAVVMPVGRVLLIKKSEYLGAIKFVQNQIREDGVYSKYEYSSTRKEHFLRKRMI